MRVLLVTGVNPGKVKIWACQETSVVGSLLPPTDLCYIAAHLERHGHWARVLDLRVSRRWKASLAAALKTFDPDLICTNLATTSFQEDMAMLLEARVAAPRARQAAFGPHAVGLPRETLAAGLDAVLVGDPEAALLNLVEGRSEGVHTAEAAAPAPALLPSLDDLPFNGPRYLELDRYHAAHHAGARRFLPLLAARGCPHRCSYCLYPGLFGRKLRRRSPVSMVDELEYLYRCFGIESVNYLDATFNLHHAAMLEFCGRLASRSLPVRYSCNARCDLLDEELLVAAAASGCSRLYLGVEDPEHADAGAKVTLDQVEGAFDLVRAHGIEAVAFLMLFPGAAGSEAAYLDRMSRLIDRIRPDALQVNVSIPFPGTPDFESARSTLSTHWSLYDPAGNRFPFHSDVDLAVVRRQVYRYFIRKNPAAIWQLLARLPPSRWVPLGVQFLRHMVLSTEPS